MSFFPTIQNDSFNSGDSVDSVYVIHTTQNDIPSVIAKENQSVYAQFDQKYNDLKWKYDECVKDNILLKNQCDYLTSKLVDFNKTIVGTGSELEYAVFENNDSILAYVDVDNICISNKIEHYFQETNLMFKER